MLSAAYEISDKYDADDVLIDTVSVVPELRADIRIY